MKFTLLTTAILATVLTVPSMYAAEKSATSAPVKAASTDIDKTMPLLQANIIKMQQQMEKFQTITDPKERQKLMQEHLSTMHENMNSMHDMGGSMMMDTRMGMSNGAHMDRTQMENGMGQGMGMEVNGKKAMMTDADIVTRNRVMDARMDMMQMMMEQMIQHERALDSMTSK